MIYGHIGSFFIFFCEQRLLWVSSTRGHKQDVGSVLVLLCGGHVGGQARNATGQGRAECQQLLMKEIYTCVAGHGIDFNAFLVMVSGSQDVQNATTTAATSPPATATSPPATSPPATATSPPATATSPPATATSPPATATSPPATATSPPATATSPPGTSPPATATSTPATAASPPSTAASKTIDVSLSKEKICGPRQEIMGCIVKSAQSIFKGSPCFAAPEDVRLNDQRFLLKEQLEAVIGQYDVYCAHPCRISLLDDMRACYSKNDLDPLTFMTSDASGPVIGATASEVEEFCEHSEPLFTCLRKSRDDCQESRVVLNSIGLDLHLMNKGVRVLCDDKAAYMHSLGCFDSHTKDVELCQTIKYRTILAMATKSRTQSWTEEQYYQEVCGIILRHIQCDLTAWEAKGGEACNENTLNLKRKLHCTLIPEQCRSSHNATVAEVCTVQRRSTGVKATQQWAIVILLSFVLVQNVGT